MQRNDIKAANGIGPGAGKSARTEATERAIRDWRAAARAAATERTVRNSRDWRALIASRPAQ